MDSTNTTAPIASVLIWLERDTACSVITVPRCAARCSHKSLMMADDDAMSSEDTVEMDAAMGPMMAMPASQGGSVCTMACGMMLSMLLP